MANWNMPTGPGGGGGGSQTPWTSDIDAATFKVTDVGGVAVGTTSLHASSLLDVASTTQGTRPFPSMTTTQRDAIVSPATGLFIYNTTTGQLNFYNGSVWAAVDTDTTLVLADLLLRDGTQSLTGNLSVDPGVTIDGVDISAHAADATIHFTVASIDHGSIAGLGDVADHPDYVTLDGARPMTADWNVGGFDLQNVAQLVQGNATPLKNAGIEVIDNQGILLSSSVTDAVTKSGLVSVAPYMNSDTEVAMLYATADGTDNEVNVGGGNVFKNSATQVSLFAGANDTTANGTEWFRLRDAGIRIEDGVTANANASAILDLVSTTLGFLPPRMTTTQRDAISSPAEGLVIHNTTTNEPNYYDGTSWQSFIGGGGGSQTPWTSDIDADTFDLEDLTQLRVQTTTDLHGAGLEVLDTQKHIIIRSTDTNATKKVGRIGMTHYTNTEQPVGMLACVSDGTDSILAVGGNVDSSNQFTLPTEIRFYAGNNHIQAVNTSEIARITPRGLSITEFFNTNADPDGTALIDMVSTDRGFLKPRMTTTQRNAISSPATGLEIYNTTTNEPNYYNGTAWTAAGGGMAQIEQLQRYNDTLRTGLGTSATTATFATSAYDSGGVGVSYASGVFTADEDCVVRVDYHASYLVASGSRIRVFADMQLDTGGGYADVRGGDDHYSLGYSEGSRTINRISTILDLSSGDKFRIQSLCVSTTTTYDFEAESIFVTRLDP